MKIYLVTEDDLVRLERISTRLFSENGMDGNEMRDAAQTIESVRRGAMEVDDDEPKGKEVRV